MSKETRSAIRRVRVQLTVVKPSLYRIKEEVKVLQMEGWQDGSVDKGAYHISLII